MAQALDDLLEALEDVDDATREEASKALAELAVPTTLDALVGACGDEYWTVRAHAGWGVSGSVHATCVSADTPPKRITPGPSERSIATRSPASA